MEHIQRARGGEYGTAEVAMTLPKAAAGESTLELNEASVDHSHITQCPDVGVVLNEPTPIVHGLLESSCFKSVESTFTECEYGRDRRAFLVWRPIGEVRFQLGEERRVEVAAWWLRDTFYGYILGKVSLSLSSLHSLRFKGVSLKRSDSERSVRSKVEVPMSPAVSSNIVPQASSSPTWFVTVRCGSPTTNASYPSMRAASTIDAMMLLVERSRSSASYSTQLFSSSSSSATLECDMSVLLWFTLNQRLCQTNAPILNQHMLERVLVKH